MEIVISDECRHSGPINRCPLTNRFISNIFLKFHCLTLPTFKLKMNGKSIFREPIKLDNE